MKLIKPFDDTVCALIIEIVRTLLDQFPQSFRKYHKKIYALTMVVRIVLCFVCCKCLQCIAIRMLQSVK